MTTGPQTWGTMLYLGAMLLFGILYFTLAVVGLSLSLALIALPLLDQFGASVHLHFGGIDLFHPASPWLWPLATVGGVLLLFATLHLARFIGRMHGRIAKQLLVSSQAY